MALQGNNIFAVTIPRWTATGDFSLSGKFTYETGTHPVFGDNAGNLHKLQCSSGGNISFTATNTYTVGGFTEGEVVTWSFTRVGNTGTFTANGTQVLKAITAPFTFDSLGQFNGGAYKFGGQWQDQLIMTGGDGSDDRSYDFNQAIGETVLPDTVGGQDGTLVGDLTGGGFLGGVGDTISITSHANWDCIQRDDNNQAVFPIEGAVAGGTVVEYELDGSGTWLVLDAAATTTYSGNVTITGQQSLAVRIQEAPAITVTIDYLSAVMAVPCWWQSNMAGYLTNVQTVTVTGSNPTPTMYKEGIFSELADQTAPSRGGGGSLVPLIAQYYSDLGIAVCFGNVAITNTKLDVWVSGTANYQLITDFHNDVGGFEFSLSIGGEADSQASTSQAVMESQLNAMVNSLNTDFGTQHKLVYFPIGDGLTGNTADIRLAFDAVIASNANCRFAGDLSVIDIDIATTAGNDGIHIKSDANALTASQIITTAINSSLLNMTGTGVPDGDYPMRVWDLSTALLVTELQVTFSGGTAVATLPTTPGKTVLAFAEGDTPPTTGIAYYGETE